MLTTTKAYLTATGKDWSLPFYDLFTKLLGIKSVHSKLINQAAINKGYRILEIGCGTGSLAILTWKLNPKAQIFGIDPDPKALARARQKAMRTNANIRFDQGFSEKLPFPDSSFNIVLSALMLHHIHSNAKQLAINEAWRILKPGGSLHIVDFGDKQSYSGGFHKLLAGSFHPRHGWSPSEKVLNLLRNAGFVDSYEFNNETTMLGRIIYYKAVRSDSESTFSPKSL